MTNKLSEETVAETTDQFRCLDRQITDKVVMKRNGVVVHLELLLLLKMFVASGLLLEMFVASGIAAAGDVCCTPDDFWLHPFTKVQNEIFFRLIIQ